MKKRVFSMLLMLVLVLTALPVTGQAAQQRLPIYCGDLRVDYLAEELLAQMDLSGKSAVEQIGTVYDWMVQNCTRYESQWDGTYYFDEAQVAQISSGAFAQQYQKDLAQGRILLRQEYRTQAGLPNTGADHWDSDSNSYVTGCAYTMLLKRNGHCGNFSSLLAVLLGHLGFDCRLVYGEFVSKFGGEAVEHTWNYILVDGTYYWADVRIDHSNISNGYETGGRDYFMIADTDQWREEHQWDSTYTDWLAANATSIQDTLNTAAAAAPGPWDQCSSWATAYMQKAGEAGLIPETLDHQDLTQTISRREFAAVAVRLFEALAYPVPTYPGASPFTDTDDADVLRAYGLGIVNGMGDGTFAPDAQLTREQAVTMLGRVYELAKFSAINGGATLPQQYGHFDDHSAIFEYARNYVYFFAGQSIVEGMGDHSFAPKSSMTREQALKIAYLTTQTLG